MKHTPSMLLALLALILLPQAGSAAFDPGTRWQTVQESSAMTVYYDTERTETTADTAHTWLCFVSPQQPVYKEMELLFSEKERTITYLTTRTYSTKTDKLLHDCTIDPPAMTKIAPNSIDEELFEAFFAKTDK